MGSRKLRGQAFVAVAVLLLLAWWAFPPQHLEIEPVATSDEGSPPVAPAAPSEVDSDPYTADLAALQELAAKLDSEPSGEDADALPSGHEL